MRNALKSYTEFVMCKVLHIVVILETPGTCFVLCKSQVLPFLKYLFHSLWSITQQGFELLFITKGNTKQGTKDILRPISITQIESCFLTSMQVSKKYYPTRV